MSTMSSISFLLFFIYQAISEFTAFNVTICNNVVQNPKVFKKNAVNHDGCTNIGENIDG